MQTTKLIKDNEAAPVDRLLRLLIDNCSPIIDNEDGEKYTDLQDLLKLWYGVDELTLVFKTSDNRDATVVLIHQDTMDRPRLEDISDYSVNLQHWPEFVALLNEDEYPRHYTA